YVHLDAGSRPRSQKLPPPLDLGGPKSGLLHRARELIEDAHGSLHPSLAKVSSISRRASPRASATRFRCRTRLVSSIHRSWVSGSFSRRGTSARHGIIVVCAVRPYGSWP